MPAKTQAVRIRRGRHSSRFQVARAFLSAASAVTSTDQNLAVRYLEFAIDELIAIKRALRLETRS